MLADLPVLSGRTKGLSFPAGCVGRCGSDHRSDYFVFNYVLLNDQVAARDTTRHVIFLSQA